MAKKILFDSEARSAVKSGIDMAARAVKGTLGPRGRNVIIDKGYGGPHMTNDGVTIAKEISLKDKFQNIGAEIVKEVANKTNDLAGDGTTTSVVILQALIDEGMKHTEMGLSAMGIRQGMEHAAKAAVAALKSLAKPVQGDKDIKQVATISAESAEIGETIAEVIKEVGQNGVVTVEDDGLTYTFTIKDGALFHDGKEVTAEDVAFTIRAAQDPTIKSPRRANWEGVTVTVIDKKTVSFSLKSPFALFLENATLGILPRALWENISPEEFPFSSLNTEPVGSGPYRLRSVKRNISGIPTEYRLKAFTRGVRVPFIENFIFRFYPNTESLMSAVSKGEVEAAHSVDPEGVTTSSQPIEAVFGRIFGVFFNQNQNEIFLEQSVREALNLAVDREAIIAEVLGGYGSPIDGPLPPSTADIFAGDNIADRIEEARAILEGAGWEMGEDGIYEKTVKKETKRLTFSLATSNVAELKQTAEMVAADWRSLGAEVELKFFDQNDLNVEVLRPRKYDALLFGLVVGDDLDLFAFWHSSQRNDPGLNIALYASIDADKSLEEARIEQDIQKRRDDVARAAEIIKKENAAVFLYTPHFIYLVPKNVAGVALGTITNPSDRFASVDEWYLSSVRVWSFFSDK